MPTVMVLHALTLDGVIYVPGQTIEPEVWLRVPERERNTLQNTAKVRVEDVGPPLEGRTSG